MPTPPQISSPTASRRQAEGAVLISSLVVLALYGYRKLIEPATVKPRAGETALRQIIGREPRPASPAQFALAYGFVFFSLSVAAAAAPELATGFAILIAVGYTLSNGASVFTDITSQVGKGSESTPSPLAGVKGGASAGASSPAGARPAGVSGEANAPYAPSSKEILAKAEAAERR